MSTSIGLFLQGFRSLSTRTRALGKTLSLDEFLFRQQVLQVYRDLMRLSYKNHEKTELIHYIQSEFKMNSKENDLAYRKYLLNTGINKINQMLPAMGILNANEFKIETNSI